MNINDFKRKIQEKQAEITKAIHRTLPIKIGRKAADHFQDNFRKGGFAVGHPPTPVSLATPPRPVPSSSKTTPISQKTATTAPSTNPTSSPDYAHSSRRKPKIATTVHSSMDVLIGQQRLAKKKRVHPTFRVMRQSCRAYSLRVKYRSSLNPYALRFITFILLLIPSTFPVEI